MNWNVSIKSQVITPGNRLVAAIYDASAPGVVVQSIALPLPYGDTKNITFTNVDAIVYDFKLFDSPNTTPTGNILNTFSFQPSLGTITTIREDMYLIGDNTPGFPSGQTDYTDDSLIGWTFDVERVGMGTLQKGVDYILILNGVPEDSTNANGFRLNVPGDVINEGERFFLHYQPLITSSPTGGNGGGSGGGNIISGSEVITGNITLDNTYMKKACLLQGSGVDHFNVTLPPLLTVADNQPIMFLSAGGSHINASIVCDTTDVISYNRALQSRLIIGQSEQLWLFKANNIWNVMVAEGNFKSVGEIVMHYIQQEINTVFANGQLLARTSYPRLWSFVSNLPASLLINDSQWNVTQETNGRMVYVNRGKFTTGNGTTTFRVPAIHLIGNLKAVDGSGRLAGSFQSDQVGQFDLTINNAAQIKKSGTANSITVLGVPPEPVSGAPPDPIVGAQSIYMGTTNNGKETIQSNIGVYALIRI